MITRTQLRNLDINELRTLMHLIQDEITSKAAKGSSINKTLG